MLQALAPWTQGNSSEEPSNGSTSKKIGICSSEEEGQSDTFKRDRRSSEVERSSPSRLSRAGSAAGSKSVSGMVERAQSARLGMLEVHHALAHATQNAGNALNDLDDLLSTAAMVGVPKATSTASSSTTYSAPKSAHGSGEVDERLDLILQHLDTLQERLDRIENRDDSSYGRGAWRDELRENSSGHGRSAWRDARPRPSTPPAGSVPTAAEDSISTNASGHGQQRKKSKEAENAAFAASSYVDNGNAYDLLRRAHFTQSGQSRSSMDALVMHLEARQARYELAQMGGGRLRPLKWLPEGTVYEGMERLEKCYDWTGVGVKLASLVAKAPRLDPKGKRRFRWLLLNLCMLCICVLVIPLRLAYTAWYADSNDAWIALELVLDLFFCVDTLVSAVTSYYKEGRSVLETNPHAVLRHYCMTWALPDLGASLPIAPLLLATGTPPAGWAMLVLRLFKLERVAKLIVVVHEVRDSKSMMRAMRSVDPAIVLLVELVVMVLLTWHWLACVWFYIAAVEGKGGPLTDELATLQGDELAAFASARPSYVISFHWAVSVTTGLGAPIRALTGAQSLYESFVVCLGIAMQSFVFGTVASAVGQVDEGARTRMRKLEAIKGYVRLKRVPLFVRERVVDFYEYVYARIRPTEESDLLEDLPSRLRIELAIVINKPFISKVEMFKSAEPGAVALLAMMMAHHTHTPDENILFEGETNGSLFFVRSGELSVFVRGGLVPGTFSTKCKNTGAAMRGSSILEEARRHTLNRANAAMVAAASDGSEIESSTGACVHQSNDEQEEDYGCRISMQSVNDVSEESSQHSVLLMSNSMDAQQSAMANSALGAAGALDAEQACCGAVGTSAWSRIHYLPGDGAAPAAAPASAPVLAPPARQVTRARTLGASQFSTAQRGRDSQDRDESPGKKSSVSFLRKLGDAGSSFVKSSSSVGRRGASGQQAPGGITRASTQYLSTSFLKKRTQSEQAETRPAPPGRLVRENTATIALRSVVKQVIAVNKEMAEEAEENRKRIQQIKDASLVDLAQLGHLVGKMSDGAAFGEQSFLSGGPSMATVRTTSFCEIMSLNHADLSHVTNAYPTLRSEMENFAQSKKQGYKAQNKKVMDRGGRRPSSVLRSLSVRRANFIGAPPPLVSGSSNRRCSFTIGGFTGARRKSEIQAAAAAAAAATSMAGHRRDSRGRLDA